MFVSVYYELGLFNAHILIMFVHSYTHVHKQRLKENGIMFKTTQYHA